MSKLRGMCLEQAAGSHQLFNVHDYRRVLQRAVAQPYFDDAEPPFRGYGDSVDPFHVFRVDCQRISAQQIH